VTQDELATLVARLRVVRANEGIAAVRAAFAHAAAQLSPDQRTQLIRMLTAADQQTAVQESSHRVAYRDTRINGDQVAGDKIGGDKVLGNKIGSITNISQHFPATPAQQQQLDTLLQSLMLLARQGRPAVPAGAPDPTVAAACAAGVPPHARHDSHFAADADAVRLIIARAMVRWQIPVLDAPSPPSDLVRQSLIATALMPLITQRTMVRRPRGKDALQALSSGRLTLLVLNAGTDYLEHTIRQHRSEAEAEALLWIWLSRALADPQYAEGCTRLLEDLCDPQRGAYALARAYQEYCQDASPHTPAPTPDVLRLLAAGALIGVTGMVLGGALVAAGVMLAQQMGDAGPEASTDTANPPPATPPATRSGRWTIPVTIRDWRTELHRRNERFGAPEGYWCYVPGGTYPIGGWEADQPSANVRLQPFWIARVPITVAQFAPFVTEGYAPAARRWWTSNGWQWKLDRKRTQPSRWHAPPFNRQPDQVVTGVTWYEAAACANWLLGQLAGALPRGYVIRLPTEAEWEAAAAFAADGRRRIYPWGAAAPTAERAVYNRNYNDGPPLVGSCPAGAAACGALDLVGTVWEVTTSRYQDYPRRSGEGREDVTPGEYDVPWRGGSWPSNSTYVRCGARDWTYPGLPDLNLINGFRVVVAPRLAHMF
jgi:formylglycine-generating enzyme required for sulfatase activity